MPPVPRLSGRDVARVPRKAGWTIDHIEGSHHIVRGSMGGVVSVPVHGAKTLPIGTIKGIIDQTGLSVAEFVALL